MYHESNIRSSVYCFYNDNSAGVTEKKRKIIEMTLTLAGQSQLLSHMCTCKLLGAHRNHIGVEPMLSAMSV